MNKEKAFIIFGTLVVLLLLALIFKDYQTKKNTPVNNPELVNNISEEALVVTKSTSSPDKFKTEVPKNIVVPTMNDQTLTVEQKKEIAVPTLVVPSAPGAVSSLRNFDIRAEGGKFTPSKIIGKSGDTMMINFTAVDNDYSIVFPSYNMRQVAKKGETKVLGFHAGETGNFTYYCDVCGENTTASGTLIITK